MAFKALLVNKRDGAVQPELVMLEDGDLMEGDVTVAVEYSTVNYKDALAVTGRAPIMQVFPLIAGIDLAGRVLASAHAGFKPGDAVLVNGWGLSQTHHGGFAQRARVPGDWLVRVPDAFDTRQAMAIGTAGYTAMLSVLALEHNGLTPDAGEVLVTGANGGVGSVAIAVLGKLGYRVVASTGRMAEADHLKALGAAEVIERGPLGEPGKPLQKARWAGAVDSVGSHTLANVLAQTRERGTVTACGLAQGMDLPTTVAPFILRNVTLAGINSVDAPQALRETAWQRLARDLDPALLASVTRQVALAEVPQVADDLFAGKVRGRVVVDVNA
ncbi:MDR family oxidoreductase [Pseudoxanthomonas winnipegensis]|uniref:Oxidoreductase n=1 Tax=Pseudoxanthomonas winnipegensis TaxID=2480810 RepID=A0A4Q8LK38_9GAMM|nr:MDR family oxidoreductase [Pseudoxanthomonas winnipegensis]RZZ82662.1 oxidoreductase [Pseudoxanthomonas winnipegensis]TAA30621.1 oxidoreductase [Pseudoxanthomonas winnipegensis]